MLACNATGSNIDADGAATTLALELKANESQIAATLVSGAIIVDDGMVGCMDLEGTLRSDLRGRLRGNAHGYHHQPGPPSSVSVQLQIAAAGFHECFEYAQVEYFHGATERFHTARNARHRSLAAINEVAPENFDDTAEVIASAKAAARRRASMVSGLAVVPSRRRLSHASYFCNLQFDIPLQLQSRDCSNAPVGEDLEAEDCSWATSEPKVTALRVGNMYTLNWDATNLDEDFEIAIYLAHGAENDETDHYLLTGHGEPCAIIKNYGESTTGQNQHRFTMPELRNSACKDRFSRFFFPTFEFGLRTASDCHNGWLSSFLLLQTFKHEVMCSPSSNEPDSTHACSFDGLKLPNNYEFGSPETPAEVTCNNCEFEGSADVHVMVRTTDKHPFAEAWAWGDVALTGDVDIEAKASRESFFDLPAKAIGHTECIPPLCTSVGIAGVSADIGLMTQLWGQASANFSGQATVFYKRKVSLEGHVSLHTKGIRETIDILKEEVRGFEFKDDLSDGSDDRAPTLQLDLNATVNTTLTLDLFMGLSAETGITFFSTAKAQFFVQASVSVNFMSAFRYQNEFDTSKWTNALTFPPISEFCGTAVKCNDACNEGEHDAELKVSVIANFSAFYKIHAAVSWTSQAWYDLIGSPEPVPVSAPLPWAKNLLGLCHFGCSATVLVPLRLKGEDCSAKKAPEALEVAVLPPNKRTCYWEQTDAPKLALRPGSKYKLEWDPIPSLGADPFKEDFQILIYRAHGAHDDTFESHGSTNHKTPCAVLKDFKQKTTADNEMTFTMPSLRKMACAQSFWEFKFPTFEFAWRSKSGCHQGWKSEFTVLQSTNFGASVAGDGEIDAAESGADYQLPPAEKQLVNSAIEGLSAAYNALPGAEANGLDKDNDKKDDGRFSLALDAEYEFPAPANTDISVKCKSCGITGQGNLHVLVRTSETNPFQEAWAWGDVSLDASVKVVAEAKTDLKWESQDIAILEPLCLTGICVGSSIAGVGASLGLMAGLKASAEADFSAKATIEYERTLKVKGNLMFHTRSNEILQDELKGFELQAQVQEVKKSSIRFDLEATVKATLSPLLYVGLIASTGNTFALASAKAEFYIKAELGLTVEAVFKFVSGVTVVVSDTLATTDDNANLHSEMEMVAALPPVKGCKQGAPPAEKPKFFEESCTPACEAPHDTELLMNLKADISAAYKLYMDVGWTDSAWSKKIGDEKEVPIKLGLSWSIPLFTWCAYLFPPGGTAPSGPPGANTTGTGTGAGVISCQASQATSVRRQMEDEIAEDALYLADHPAHRGLGHDGTETAETPHERCCGETCVVTHDCYDPAPLPANGVAPTSGLWCCRSQHICMDRSTGSTAGPTCNECEGQRRPWLPPALPTPAPAQPPPSPPAPPRKLRVVLNISGSITIDDQLSFDVIGAVDTATPPRVWLNVEHSGGMSTKSDTATEHSLMTLHLLHIYGLSFSYAARTQVGAHSRAWGLTSAHLPFREDSLWVSVERQQTESSSPTKTILATWMCTLTWIAPDQSSLSLGS